MTDYERRLNENLYGKIIKVIFVKKLRDEENLRLFFLLQNFFTAHKQGLLAIAVSCIIMES